MRKVVIFSLVAGFLSACADALPVTDVATVTNYLAQTYSEQRGISNANVRVLTVDEAVASVDMVFAKAPTGNFSSDCLARMKRLLRESLAFAYSYDATVVGKPLEYRFNGKRTELSVGTSFSVYAYRERLFDSDIGPVYSFSRTASIGPRFCSGWVAWVSKSGGKVFYLQHIGNDESGILPFSVRRIETAVSTGVWEKVEGIGPAGEKRWRTWRSMQSGGRGRRGAVPAFRSRRSVRGSRAMWRRFAPICVMPRKVRMTSSLVMMPWRRIRSAWRTSLVCPRAGRGSGPSSPRSARSR